MTDHEHADHAVNEMWREVLVNGHRDTPASYLPGSPRCGMCLIPLGGVGGVLMKTLRGRSQSRKNPAMCNL
ncbi:MAG: hypothetical protein O7B81_06685 [Gammaproteobacteria bacterium]|nr:hypothetical protein [Gammaproteobacteria bacterium]